MKGYPGISRAIVFAFLWAWSIGHVPAVAMAADPTPVVFQLHWQPQSQFAGYIMAREKGFFEKAGLAARLVWTKAGERPFDGLAERRCDFCTGWLSDAMREREAGKPLVLLSQVFRRSSTMLVTRRHSGIRTPQDLDGRRVGLWGGNHDVQSLAFFAKYDVRPVIVPQSASITPFLRGAVDAASAMHYNEYHLLLDAGLSPDELHVFAFAEYGLAFPEDGIYCTEATRRERPKLCAAVAAACREGWNYALNHEAETIEAVMRSCRAENVRTNRNHQRWMLRTLAPVVRDGAEADPASWGRLAPETYRGVGQILVEQRILRDIPEFERFFQPPEPWNHSEDSTARRQGP